MKLGRHIAAVWALALAVAVILLANGTGLAVELPDRNRPALLLADELVYDEELGVVVATGNVEISQGDRVLLADSVTYNENTNTVTASGNVSIIEPTGDVFFGDFVELTDDLREGAIQSIRLLLHDGSRMAAASAIRTGGNRTLLNRAVFSPCDLCEEDRMRAPLWQIKAVRVVHDQETKRIEYQDAWLEISGIPVFYTPYFSHPDPTVERQSGFLAPSFGASDDLGLVVQPAYYWAIASNEDITFTPIVTTKQSIVAMGEYRRRVSNGIFNVALSATIADREDEEGGMTVIKEDQFRGHIDAFGRFDLTRNWRWGFDVQRATDKTYMRLYDLSTERSLTSRAFAEGFYGRSYAAINAYAFQGTRDFDDNAEAPIVAPLVELHHITEPGVSGGYYTFDAGLMSLNRIDGRDSQRLSVAGAWTLPYTGPMGDIYRFTASLRGDGYWVNQVDPNSDDPDPSGPTVDGFEGRIFPQLAFQWSLPLVRHVGDSHEVLEPIFSLIASPGGGNTGHIPNEDSQDFEFDETHLFDPDRFTGLDRVDSGQRIDYGLKWTSLDNDGASLSVFFGQSIRLGGGSPFSAGSGLRNDFSDVVGRIQVSPLEYLDLIYRFRIDASDMIFERTEIGFVAGPPEFNLAGSYTYIDGSGNDFGDREELTGTLSSRLSETWSAFLVSRYDIDASSFLTYGGGLTYEDECLLVRFSAIHNQYSDDEIDPSTDFLLQLGFKYLGDVGLPF
jgi:LPS-assembly protein